MSKAMTTKSEQKSVLFNQIYVPGEQIRQDLPDIPELAADMKERGQLQPVIVSNGGVDGKPYVLRAGFRRAAAYEHNNWHNKEIMVIVRQYTKDPLEPVFDNWIDNTLRENFSPIDQGAFIDQLLTGTYPVIEGEVAVKLTKKEVAAKLKMSESHLAKLQGVFRDIDPKVQKKARSNNTPVRFLIAISHVEGEGKEEEAIIASRAEKQMAKLESWIAEQKELEATGRQRRKRKDTGKSKRRGDDEEVAPPMRETRRVEHAVYREKTEDGEGRAYRIADVLSACQKKREVLADTKGVDAKEAAIHLAGVIDGIRFSLGKKSKIDNLNVSDFKLIEEKVAEE